MDMYYKIYYSTPHILYKILHVRSDTIYALHLLSLALKIFIE